MKSRQQVLSEFRSAEILNAARIVFARQGFERGMIEDIARQAGIAKGTVYLYFRSKAEIYKALLVHDMKELKRETMQRINAAPTLREKLYAFALTRMEHAHVRREFFRVMDSEQRNLSMTRSQYRDFLYEPVQCLTTAIAEAAEKGDIRALPAEKVAWMLANAVRGEIQRRLLGASESSIAEDAVFLTEFFWSALTCDSGAQ
jgi:AcrR family transcriptional regulator